MMDIYAVICAAGAGTRFGQNKALCRISGGDTFLESIVKTLRICGVHRIIVVTGAEHQKVMDVHGALDVSWVHNYEWQSTYMLESLGCGLQEVPEHYQVIHWPVDCLFIHPEDLRRLIDAPHSSLAVLCWDGRPGHPMRMSGQTADELRTHYRDYSSLRDFVQNQPRLCIDAHHRSLVNCNDAVSLDAFLARQ